MVHLRAFVLLSKELILPKLHCSNGVLEIGEQDDEGLILKFPSVTAA
jgi:hypothetical protein